MDELIAADNPLRADAMETDVRVNLGTDDLAGTVRAFIESPGETTRLRALGLRRQHLSKVAIPALEMLQARSVNGNARNITGVKDVNEILELAWYEAHLTRERDDMGRL